jgi:hypothetical protein
MQPPNNQQPYGYPPQGYYQPRPPKKPQPKLGPFVWWVWLVIGFGGLVAIVAALQAVGIVPRSSDQTATAVAQRAAVQTSTVEARRGATITAVAIFDLTYAARPTSTPRPTETPVPPTPTPDVPATETAKANEQATIDANRAKAGTEVAQKQEATVTAAAQRQLALEKYKTTPPQGDFLGSGGGWTVVANGTAYRQSIGYFSANSNSKFIVFNVRVLNQTGKNAQANPLYFTLVSTDGGAVSIDSNTFGLGSPLQAVDLPNGSYTDGQIAFLVTKEFVPGRLIYKTFTSTATITIVS